MEGINIVPIAVIDIGTNSTRLLVAEVSPEGKIIPLLTDLNITRLGEGIKGGLLLPGPVSRTVEAIRDMQARAAKMSVSSFLATATSAVRDAANREWFLEEVYRKAGLAVRVLEGQQEAYLSYMGVAGGFSDLGQALIIDIGGGSTEFTWKKGDLHCRSVNAGAVRMTEGNHTDGEILQVMKDVLEEIRLGGAGKLIGVGGTVTTLAAMDLALESYDRSRVHGYALSRNTVENLKKKLVAAGPAGRKRIPGLQPERADIIVAGVRILLLLMDALEFDQIIVSEADLMYGLLYELKEAVDKNIGPQDQK
ncbi:MAG: Ppx/GppA phosphatase family protein [Desulfocucumaceae bacterium]